MAENNVQKIKESLEKTTIHNLDINRELEASFLEYAMSVIIARAIPDARDGFKPVHRRVLYAAYGLGLSSDKPHKKSARIVGEVIGKYHPHGDTAAYDTMVRMAQNFSLRYPLIDGHGNFGSTDDGPAAMRYTEARLSKVADTILEDIEKDTVDYIDNYDGSELEPTVLTAIFPNLLANGSSGIAVGIATNIPPHNLTELIDAIKLLAHNENVTVDEIKTVLKGPDFPTGAEIIGIDGIDSYFRTGRGSVIIRSKTQIKYLDNGKSIIIINELPFAVGKKDLLDKITELVRNKTIEGISDLQDYSNRDGIHIEIETKKDVIPEVLLNQLYKKTSLQTSFGVNMIALVNGEPKLLSVIDALKIYLDHQINVLIRKLNFELKNAKERQHILQGLHIATGNIDEVIKIIKEASDNASAQAQLITKFGLSEIQAKAILDMKLRSLSGLERKKIEDELIAITNRINEINQILTNKDQQINLIIASLDLINKKFGDQRKSIIRSDITSNIGDEDLIPKENILITISQRGYLKRLPIDTFRTQARGGVGVIGTQTYDDDDIKKIITANTHTDLLIFSNFGRVYRIRGHEIPMGSRTAKGTPVINVISSFEKDERVVTIVPNENYNNDSLFFVSLHGVIKRTLLSEFVNINCSGKIAISLRENDQLFDVLRVSENDEIYIGGSNGNMVRFACNQVRNMGRTAAGVGGINLNSNESVIGVSSSASGNNILSVGNKGVGKITPVDQYRATKRNAKGVRTLKVNQKTGNLICIKAVSGEEDLLMITSTGKVIRIALSKINIIGRNTSGVRLMRVEDKEVIVSITLFAKGEFGEETDNNEVIEEKVEE
jgi:DNA gyrase subunit A